MYLQFPIQLHLDVIQKGQVELLANDILFPLLQKQSAAMVRRLDTPEEIIGDIIGVAPGWPNGHCATIGMLVVSMSTDPLQPCLILGLDDVGAFDDVLCSHRTHCAEQERANSEELHCKKSIESN